LKNAIRIGSALIFALTLTVPVGASAHTDPRSVSLFGIHLGMTPGQVMPILVQQYGRGNVRAFHVVCFRSYLAALHRKASEAPASCTRFLGGSGNKRNLDVIFVEDVAQHHYGRMIATEISYVQHLGSDADRAAFGAHALVKYGQPDNSPGFGVMEWCSNVPASGGGCNGAGLPFGPFGMSGDITAVRPNDTPYGYWRNFDKPSIDRTLGEWALNDGIITIHDKLTEVQNAYAFSLAVNPRTTGISF
jgi:hypothetical protein